MRSHKKTVDVIKVKRMLRRLDRFTVMAVLRDIDFPITSALLMGEGPIQCCMKTTGKEENGEFMTKCEKECPTLKDKDGKDVKGECRLAHYHWPWNEGSIPGKLDPFGGFQCICIYKAEKAVCKIKKDDLGSVTCSGECPPLKDKDGNEYAGECIPVRILEGKDTIITRCVCVYKKKP